MRLSLSTSHLFVSMLAGLAIVVSAGCAPASPPQRDVQQPQPLPPAAAQPPVAAPPAAPKQVPVATFPERPRELFESTGEKYMVVSQGEATTRAARKMFELGGNVIDAAVAASFTVSVERPQSTGIAGGGFMMIRLASGEVLAVDFREMAPAKANRDMYLDKKKEIVPNLSTDGGLASGVPGMVAGVLAVHEKYGKLKRADVLQPAIALAEGGFDVYPHIAAAIDNRKEVLKKSPEALKMFFKDGDKPLAVGDRVRQPGLGKVLREIAKAGRDGFYKGWVADALVAEQKRQGGFITAKDLASYEVKFRKPVRGEFGPYTIYSMPPPSSGGVHVVQIVDILEGYKADGPDPYAVPVLHHTASAMQLAYFDRAKYLGDSDFVRVPVPGLTSQRYADALRAHIPEDKAIHLSANKPAADPLKYESPETTHFTIADREGNMVASTQTINGWFGSGVVVQGGGFVLNNQMDDFSAKPGVPNKFGVIGGEENAIAAGKRPLSSMSPTLVLQNDKPVLALGSPAGSQIINCVTLTLLNVVAYHLPLWDAVTALRYHHQWTPDILLVEAPGFPEQTTQALQAMGHNIKVGGIGCKVEAIAYEQGGLRGVADPRGEGLAAGEKPIPEVKRPDQTKQGPVHQD